MRLLNVAVAIFTDHPLLGAGPAGFQVLSPRYVGPLLADRYPHNAVLQFAAEFGLVGVGLFLVIVALAVSRKIPPGNAWWTVRVAFVFSFLNSLLSGDILEDRMFWGLLLLLAQVVPVITASGSPREPFRIRSLRLPVHAPP